MDGGMMMASEADDEVIAAASVREYPRFFISGIKTVPVAATSATAEPEISANTIETPMLTMPSPPRTNPISAETKLISLTEMPDVFIRLPARMNSGMAISGNLVAPVKSAMAMSLRAGKPDVMINPPIATSPMDTAIGTFIMIRVIRAIKAQQSKCGYDPAANAFGQVMDLS